ncbi:hypothetical protein BM74_05750 [Bacillus thuringiensis]|uniref:Uncharacterized protein n=1 Tax=Bacillus thuringiensis TaxID=1428 RepID=A0A437SPD0_BACTU|nr:hypothetical protein CR195_019565 [Bacillus cereus]RVU65128.1 hypothetical protein BM74_05750 [Bacillus thuringiensis]
MHYAFSFSFFALIYFEVPLFINFSNRFIFSVNAPFTREKSVFGASFFSLKNEDFFTLISAISSPPFQKRYNLLFILYSKSRQCVHVSFSF